MITKKTLAFLLTAAIFIYLAPMALAQGLEFTPQVEIPITVEGTNFASDNLSVEDGTFLARYIVAIYSYGAGFAGIVAMFMLVLAGWKWLMAAGNPSKIQSAKETINGVLIGLALLFGGQLLLRQISSNFSLVKSLDIHTPITESCGEFNLTQCGGFVLTSPRDGEDEDFSYYCRGLICEPDKSCVYLEGVDEELADEDSPCDPRIGFNADENSPQDIPCGCQ